jgi:hypothetical protein
MVSIRMHRSNRFVALTIGLRLVEVVGAILRRKKETERTVDR